ncbi:hypothetical protein ACFU6R_01920 [Streptomyces sp. NPDC057499]|uniref:hypothetical protein n=1 Tax=Streptomyces sp. NPDC057499 TaxID=3346150 RepID=UPI003697B212
MRSTTPRPAIRRLVGAVAAGAALATTSGCTVPIDAVAGISVTDDGHLLGAIMVCGHHIDGATLHVDTDDANNASPSARWTADHPLAPGLTTWPLDPPAPGWSATGPLTSLAPRTTYALYGWTKDNSWSSGHVTFTLADLDGLTPGKVYYNRSTGIGEETAVTVSTAEFRTAACPKN